MKLLEVLKHTTAEPRRTMHHIKSTSLQVRATRHLRGQDNSSKTYLIFALPSADISRPAGRTRFLPTSLLPFWRGGGMNEPLASPKMNLDHRGGCRRIILTRLQGEVFRGDSCSL